MKTFNLLLLLLIFGGLIFLTSCPAPPPCEPPYITIFPLADTIYYNDTISKTVTFKIEISADLLCEHKLSEFNVKENDIILKTYDLGDSVYSYLIDYEYTLSDTVKTEKTITLIFSAIDDRDIKTTRKAKIFITEKKPPQPIIISFENITMNYNNTTTSGWYSATNFLGIDSTSVLALNPNENSEKFDIAIFYQSTVGKVFCAPDNSFLDIIYNININSGYSSEGKNNTKLQKIQVDDWFNLTVDFINNLSITTPLVDSADVTKGYGVSNVEIGDFIAFETFDGIKGILKINNYNKGQFSITFDAKMVVMQE